MITQQKAHAEKRSTPVNQTYGVTVRAVVCKTQKCMQLLNRSHLSVKLASRTGESFVFGSVCAPVADG